MAEIIIRPITPDDTDAIAEMWLALIAYHRNLDASLPEAAPGGQYRYVRRIMERLDDPYTCALVAEEEGRVVGYVLGMIVDLMQDIFAQQPGGFLADIYVEPFFRKRGVGRALVEGLRSWFRQNGVKSFDWHVSAHNPDALAFWRAVGGRDVMMRMRAEVGAKK